MSAAAPFLLDVFSETPGRFHGRDLLRDPAPRVVVCRANAAALVLGSAQRVEVVDGQACARRHVEVVRRRSGGGAVFVEPDAMVWFDVVIPADDPRFADVAFDVTRSMRWIGGHVNAALATMDIDDISVHEGPMECREWCRLVCFAGTAPGELELRGNKLVGISQRRTRAGSRFQCAVHTQWSPESMLELLVPPRPHIADLPGVATVDTSVADALPGALVAVLDAL